MTTLQRLKSFTRVMTKLGYQLVGKPSADKIILDFVLVNSIHNDIDCIVQIGADDLTLHNVHTINAFLSSSYLLRIENDISNAREAADFAQDY